jgi:hypothetical protein
MEKPLKEEKNITLLCCGRKGCPTISIKKDGTVLLRDDYEGVVKLDKEQFNLFKKLVKDGSL